MASQTRKQIITIQYCPISQKDHQTVTFGQLMEYNIRKCGGENVKLVPDPIIKNQN